MTVNASVARYTFDSDSPHAKDHLHYLAEAFDPQTIRTLAACGVPPGGYCLEVGAGLGSIAHLLSRRVGPEGCVLATDLKLWPMPAAANLDFVLHDIRVDPLPPSAFDLIHVRHLLVHLPEREKILHKLVGALKPGGALMVEEWDYTWRGLVEHSPEKNPIDADLFERFNDAILAIMAANGADLTWGNRVRRVMRDTGLGRFFTMVNGRWWRGGEGFCGLQHAHSYLLGDQLLDGGMSSEELAVLRRAFLDPELVMASYPMCTTIGHRPE